MQTQLVLPIEKFSFLVLANDAMLQHLIRVVFNWVSKVIRQLLWFWFWLWFYDTQLKTALSICRSIICQVVAYRMLKTRENFKLFNSSKSGRGCLREVVAYKRFRIKWFDLKTFGMLENWSLGRGGRLREVVATGGSTLQLFVIGYLQEIRSSIKHAFIRNISYSLERRYSLFRSKEVLKRLFVIAKFCYWYD